MACAIWQVGVKGTGMFQSCICAVNVTAHLGGCCSVLFINLQERVRRGACYGRLE